MNDDPVVLEEAMQAAAVLGAALARFQNALDRLREPSLSPREELMGPAGVAQPSTGGGGWLNGPMGSDPS